MDADLWYYSDCYLCKSRRKKFDGKINFLGDLARFNYVAKLNNGSDLYTEIVYCVALEKKIRVVLPQTGSPGQTASARLFSMHTEIEALSHCGAIAA